MSKVLYAHQVTSNPVFIFLWNCSLFRFNMHWRYQHGESVRYGWQIS